MRHLRLLLLMSAIACAKVSGQPAVQSPSYVGCYIDNSSTENSRDLKGLLEFATIGPYTVPSSTSFVVDVTAMTIEKCSGICAMGRFRYFGLQATAFCLCGSSYGLYGSAAESQCYQSCTGNSSQKCGGPDRNSVYENIYKPGTGFFMPMASNASALTAAHGVLLNGTHWSQTAALVFECFAACHRSPDCLACAFVQSSRMCRLLRFAAVPSEIASETQWVWMKL